MIHLNTPTRRVADAGWLKGRSTMRIFLAVMALMMLLAACDGQKKDVKDTVFGSQLQMKDKARAVENTLRQGAEKNREAIESSEKPGEPEQK